MFTLFLENYKLKDNPTYIYGIPSDTLMLTSCTNYELDVGDPNDFS